MLVLGKLHLRRRRFHSSEDPYNGVGKGERKKERKKEKEREMEKMRNKKKIQGGVNVTIKGYNKTE